MVYSAAHGTTYSLDSARNSARTASSFLQYLSDHNQDSLSPDQRRWAIYKPSWWPPRFMARSRSRSETTRPTSSRFSFRTSLPASYVPENMASSGGRTPAEQVVDNYLSMQTQRAEEPDQSRHHILKNSNSRIRHAVHIIWSSLRRQPHERGLLAMASPDLGSTGQDDHPNSRGNLPAECGYSGTSNSVVVEDTALKTAVIAARQPPSLVFHPQGDWAPRVQAALEAQAVADSTQPGELVTGRRPGCNVITTDARSQRIHLLAHNTTSDTGNRSTNNLTIGYTPSGPTDRNAPAAPLLEDYDGFSEPQTVSNHGSFNMLDDEQNFIQPHIRLDMDEHFALAKARFEAEAVANSVSSSKMIVCPRPNCEDIVEPRRLKYHLHAHNFGSSHSLVPSPSIQLADSAGPSTVYWHRGRSTHLSKNNTASHGDDAIPPPSHSHEIARKYRGLRNLFTRATMKLKTARRGLT